MSQLSHSRGLTAMILAYMIWGLFPIYWRALNQVPPFELLQLRLILTALACLFLMPLRGSWNTFKSSWAQPDVLRLHLLAALLLAANWYAFIWAVGSGRVLESSLGYFLCPLVTVILGRCLEKEPMGSIRLAAVICAIAGVGILILLAGRLPLAALVIAVTWSSYGLIKKRNPLGPVVSLGIETSLLSPIAAGILLLLVINEPLSVQSATPVTLWLLVICGFLTALPLLLFAFGAQRLRLTTMGMGQYIVPSSHFFLAIYFGEPMNMKVLFAFVLIWSGLGLYSIAALRADKAHDSV